LSKGWIPEGYFDIKQAAEKLGISTRTVRRYIKTGRLSAHKVKSPYGEVWVIPEEEVNTAQEITDVVSVKREYDVKDLALAINQYLNQRDKKLDKKLDQIMARLDRMEQLVIEREKRLKERDQKLMECIRKIQGKDQQKKPWWKKIFNI